MVLTLSSFLIYPACQTDGESPSHSTPMKPSTPSVPPPPLASARIESQKKEPTPVTSPLSDPSSADAVSLSAPSTLAEPATPFKFDYWNLNIEKLVTSPLNPVEKQLYERRLKDFSPAFQADFLKHAPKSPSDPQHASSQNAEIGPYLSLMKEIKTHWHRPVIKGKKRILSHEGRYKTSPLQANQILLISGGDVHKERLFPLLVHHAYQKFAEKSGYRFSYFEGNMAGIDFPHGGRYRQPYWNKIYLLLDRLEDEKNKVIVWMDDDGIIGEVGGKGNMIERYLEKYPDQDLIIAQDPQEYAFLNTGIMIVRNTPLMKELLLETLKVGEESREVIDDGYDEKGHRSPYMSSLMACKQSFHCLHEQQALQELYIPTRREYDSNSSAWIQAKQTERHTSRNWKESIALVPQFDPTTGLNMNIFISYAMYQAGKLDHFSYRDHSNQQVTLPYSSHDPLFFMQCSGKVDKHACIATILVYLNTLSVKEIPSIIFNKAWNKERGIESITEAQILTQFGYSSHAH